MNNECGNAHTVSSTNKRHYCNLGKGHDGDHADMQWNWPHMKAVATWPQRCLEERDGFVCTLAKGHTRDHEAKGSSGKVHRTWRQETPPFKIHFIEAGEETPKTYRVLLTLEELKSVVYALAGEEWLEDEPELVEKFDKALKEAL